MQVEASLLQGSPMDPEEDAAVDTRVWWETRSRPSFRFSCLDLKPWLLSWNRFHGDIIHWYSD